MHDRRFPNETAAYRQARDELLQAELDLRAQLADVAAKRRQLPTGGEVPEDYVFTAEVAGEPAQRLFDEYPDGALGAPGVAAEVLAHALRQVADGETVELACPKKQLIAAQRWGGPEHPCQRSRRWKDCASAST